MIINVARALSPNSQRSEPRAVCKDNPLACFIGLSCVLFFMYLLRPAFEEPFNKNVKIWCGSAAKPMGYLKTKAKVKRGFWYRFWLKLQSVNAICFQSRHFFQSTADRLLRLRQSQAVDVLASLCQVEQRNPLPTIPRE